MEAWAGGPKIIGLNFRGPPAESETGRGTDGILWDCPPLLNYWHFDLKSELKSDDSLPSQLWEERK